jgi:hypothetical protein
LSFVDLDVETDPTQLVNDSLDQLNYLLAAADMPGWDSASADTLVLFLEAVADIAVDVQTTASTVQSAIFRAYGTQIVGIPYVNGTKASVTTTWSFTTPAPIGGYNIDSGTAVLIDNQAFYVQDDVYVEAGSASTTVQLTASDVGTAYNDLGGINVGAPDVEMNDQIDWVASVTTASQTSGGTDQEDDDTYQDKLVAALRLQAPRPITASDFAEFVVSDLAVNATGVAVGRSTSIDGYYPQARSLSSGGTGPAPLTGTATLASGSPTVTLVAPPYYGAAPFPGATVTGTAIPASTTVLASPVPSSTGFTMSGNATTAETGETIVVSAWQGVERCVTTFVTDAQGNALMPAQMDALQTWLDGYREESFLAFVEAPSYNEVYVSAQVHVTPAYVGAEANVEANVQSTVVNYLSPLTWGNISWLNATSGFNVVRLNSLIAVAEGVQGVQYVVPGSLKLGFAASPTGTADITMTGPAPLPLTDPTTVTITSDN